MRTFDVEIGDETLLVIVLPDRPRREVRLTPAERAIVEDVIAGRSNAEIAANRGRSPRTVANQLAMIYRKLGIVSRAELALCLLGP